MFEIESAKSTPRFLRKAVYVCILKSTEPMESFYWKNSYRTRADGEIVCSSKKLYLARINANRKISIQLPESWCLKYGEKLPLEDIIKFLTETNVPLLETLFHTEYTGVKVTDEKEIREKLPLPRKVKVDFSNKPVWIVPKYVVDFGDVVLPEIVTPEKKEGIVI